MRVLLEDKKVEMVIFEEKELSDRPHWGEQWDRHELSFLLNLGMENAIEKYIRKYLQGKERVLILGMGLGSDVGFLKDKSRFIVEIDLSTKRVKECQRLFKDEKISFLVCEADFLPFRESSFEVIFSKAILHHLPYPQYSIAEVYRVANKNAVLIIAKPGLLNPIAMIGRKFFPTNIHTPSEHPFKLSILIGLISKYFNVVESHFLYFSSLIVPILSKYFPTFKKIVKSVFLFDSILLENVPMLSELCWITVVCAGKIRRKNSFG